MVGHLKTCLILVLGFVVFHYAVVWRNLFGIAIAVVGMIWYTEQKRQEGAKPAIPKPNTTAPLDQDRQLQSEDLEIGGKK